MEEEITMPPKDEINIHEAFRIFLDDKEVTSSNPFGFSLNESGIDDKYILIDREKMNEQIELAENAIDEMTEELDKLETCSFEFDVPESNLDNIREVFRMSPIGGEYECASIEEGKITFEREDGQQIFFECKVNISMTEKVKVGDKFFIHTPQIKESILKFKEISKEQQEKVGRSVVFNRNFRSRKISKRHG